MNELSRYEKHNLEQIGVMDPTPFFKHKQEIKEIIKKAEESTISPNQHEKLFEACLDAFMLGVLEGRNEIKN